MPPDFRFPAEIEIFRDEVRAFLRDEMAPSRVAGHGDQGDLTGLDEDFERAHHRRAGSAGFLGISAPREFGGGGRPPSFASIYQYEAAYHDAPSIDTALVLCGAPVVAFGRVAQQERYLPRMIRGEITGCIAYSEREAGSDLSGLETTAHHVDGSWRLSGTKTLVTGGHKADMCVTIARSDPSARTRAAMTMFLLDLPHPGVVVRRRATINRWTLSEIDFEGAQLDEEALLGPVGSGWGQVTAALAQERSGMAHLGWAARLLDELAAFYDRDRRRLHDHHRRALARLEMDLDTGLRLAGRIMADQDHGRPLTWEPAAAKVHATELLQRLTRVAAEAVGVEALAGDGLFDDVGHAPLGGRLAWAALECIHPTIGAGANEVHRDFLARSLVGLPRVER